MSTEERSRYFQELTHNLQREGYTVTLETEEGHLPVELEGQRLCLVLDTGGVRYWKEDVAGDVRSEALDKVTGIARTTAEYMRQIELVPQLIASGLEGDFRLLAEFNGIILAGHQTQYGAQFVTWERSTDQTSLCHGHYYGPGTAGSYIAAKQDFAVRSGLVPQRALFTPEQLTEVYRSIHDTLENAPITDERRKCLESTVEQIEHGIPDLEAQVELSHQKELELAAMESSQDGRMKFS